MLTISSAMRNAISSPSIAQGPASRKKLLPSVCFILGIFESFISIYLDGKDTALYKIMFLKEALFNASFRNVQAMFCLISIEMTLSKHQKSVVF